MAPAPVASGAIPSNTRVFISYSRKDIAFADRLEAALKERGFDVLIDRQEIYAFEDWWKRIEALSGRADTVVFVLSPEAVKSDVALKEVAYAASLNKRFAPIVCRRVEDGAVPEALRRLNFVFFDDPGRFDASADALADALETDISWIRQHTEYGEAERRWSAAGRPNGLLLQPPTLDLAEHWIISRPRNAPEATKEIQSYIVASRRRARTSQRVRRIAQASIFTLLVGIILGLVGWINQVYIIAKWHWWTVTYPYMHSRVRPYVLSAAQEHKLKPKDIFIECVTQQSKYFCPQMVMVPAGSFLMGSRRDEEDVLRQAKPQHPVTIARPFAVGRFEVTFDEWDTCVTYGDCPDIVDGKWGRFSQPVINVTRDDALRYVNWLSTTTGKPYRLLTEAEYEYAARGRTDMLYPWGDNIPLNGSFDDGTSRANCKGCDRLYGVEVHAPSGVGLFLPNGFGLYDMVGNVWEWVEDCKHTNYDGAPSDGSAWTEGGDCRSRAIRGGSWDSDPTELRVSYRLWSAIGRRSNDLGFRVARTLDTP